MFAGVAVEASSRIGAARALLRVVEAHEQALSRSGVAAPDDASRSAKGLLFVQNYAVYEFVVVRTVRALVAMVNSRTLQCAKARCELLTMALDAEFASIIGGSMKKTWDSRSELLTAVRSSDTVSIKEGLFPRDGSHFRPPQLELIWNLFGLPGPIVPEPRLRGHIVEMVDERNRIAHGDEAPDSVGRRFTVSELQKRLDDTEAVCTHILTAATTHSANPLAFQ